MVYYQSNSVLVEVSDTCPGCSSTSVDLTPTAFQVLSPLSAGRLTGISWSFVDCTSGIVADQTSNSQDTLTLSQPLVIGLAVGVPLFVVGVIVAIVVIIKTRKQPEERV